MLSQKELNLSLVLFNDFQSQLSNKRSRKLTKIDDKTSTSTNIQKVFKIQKIVPVLLKPQTSIKSNLFFLTEYSLIALSKPDFIHDKILGQIPGSFFSHSHKLGNVSFNFIHQYVLVQMELILTNRMSLDYVKTLYEKFRTINLCKALKVVDMCKQNAFQRMTLKTPFLQEDTWMDYLLEHEELPAFAQRISCVSDKPKLEFVYNKNFLQLAGVLPNIMIDAIMQSQQIPELSTDDDISRWINLNEGFIKSFENSVINEYQSMVVTYEGMRVGVKVKEVYLHSFVEATECHYYVRKITYCVTNPKSYEMLFDQKRILRNPLNYLEENKIPEINRQSNNQLKFETSSEMQAKYKEMKPCSYKFKEID